jgi:serpin B
VAAADGINAFGLDLFREAAPAETNVVLSPASIAIALGMARVGARGQTGDEMDATLHDVASEDHAGWLNALDAALASRSGTFSDDSGDDHELTLRIANSYFAQRDMPLEDAFLEGLASRFDAGVHLVDFAADADSARSLINTWASEQTEDRIPEVLLPGDVSAATRIALVNAIYLKAPWQTPFRAEQTADADFTRPDGSVVRVPTMHQAGILPCAEGTGWSAVELPYIGGKLAMLVIVPEDVAAFETSLDTARFREITDAVAESGALALVALPRFGIEWRENLAKQILPRLGMQAAFDPDLADFSGLTSAERLYIAVVIHQANIDVDEQGTEAAAVTVVGGDTGGGPEDECRVTADRPFLFALRDVETGAVLFLGKVGDPS